MNFLGQLKIPLTSKCQFTKSIILLGFPDDFQPRIERIESAKSVQSVAYSQSRRTKQTASRMARSGRYCCRCHRPSRVRTRADGWRSLWRERAGGLAGCIVLSMYNGSAGSAALATPSQLCSSSFGIGTERRKPFFWIGIGRDSTPRKFPITMAKIAGGPPAFPLAMVVIACFCSFDTRSSMIRPTDQFPLPTISATRRSDRGAIEPYAPVSCDVVKLRVHIYQKQDLLVAFCGSHLVPRPLEYTFDASALHSGTGKSFHAR